MMMMMMNNNLLLLFVFVSFRKYGCDTTTFPQSTKVEERTIGPFVQFQSTIFVVFKGKYIRVPVHSRIDVDQSETDVSLDTHMVFCCYATR
eukprot:m.118387 g.118387  ORF g.118387 m.118387 type:complete len:91 (+) comp15447_c2_seq2:2-274(+)